MSDPARRTRHPFLPLFLLGLIGVASLPFVVGPMLRAAPPPLPPGVTPPPFWAMVMLSLINPVLFLAIGTAVGAWCVPRLGLVSHVVARAEAGRPVWPALRREAPLALGIGAGVALLIIPLDLLFEPHLGTAWREAVAKLRDQEPAGPGAVLAGLLYGGITEEIMLRWGMLSFLAWAGWRLFQRRRSAPGSAVMWGAIIGSAALFGVGHLPAVAALAPLTPILAVRTVALNAVAGLALGWLFWRRSLEAAMLAHATANLVAALARASGLLPS